MVEALWRHSHRRQLEGFLAQGDRCGWCRHPIRLRGHASRGTDKKRTVVFSSASLPDGVVLKACGTRSELQCPACAWVYRGDARHLVRAGLEGGKGVDESVATHPAVFLTLTAPGFGVVHGLRAGSPCHPKRPVGTPVPPRSPRHVRCAPPALRRAARDPLLPRLLRLRRRRHAERQHLRAVATNDHLYPTPTRRCDRVAHSGGSPYGSPRPLQSGRVPAPWRRPSACRRAGRRPRWHCSSDRYRTTCPGLRAGRSPGLRRPSQGVSPMGR